MTDAVMDVEKKAATFFKDVTEAGRKKCMDKGMKAITFSPEDAKWFVDKFYDSHWDAQKQTVSPEAFEKLRSLMTKRK